MAPCRRNEVLRPVESQLRCGRSRSACRSRCRYPRLAGSPIARQPAPQSSPRLGRLRPLAQPFLNDRLCAFLFIAAVLHLQLPLIFSDTAHRLEARIDQSVDALADVARKRVAFETEQAAT